MNVNERRKEVKTINFQMKDELHKKMRMETVRLDKSIKQYITDLIEKDLRTKNEKE